MHVAALTRALIASASEAEQTGEDPSALLEAAPRRSVVHRPLDFQFLRVLRVDFAFGALHFMFAPFFWDFTH